MELTADEAMAMAGFIADHLGGDAQEYIDDGTMDGLELTRDPFDCFDGKVHNGHQWSDWSGQEFDTVGGRPAVYYEAAQTVKGQRRVHLWVVDFGDFRAIYQQ
jgi:hypothetical protein